MTDNNAAKIALEALGHVRVKSDRCGAAYKDSVRPVWCDLQAGHVGPHRHVAGHHWMIMLGHKIEMREMPDICRECGTRWPCRDAQKVIAAFDVAAVGGDPEEVMG